MTIRTFLSAGDVYTVINNNVQVFGGAGAEKVQIMSGVTGLVVDPNVDRVELSGNMSSYKFVNVAGTGLQIQDANNNVISTIASVNQNDTIAFADGSAPLVQNATGFTVAGTQVVTGATTAAATVAATTALSTADKSTVPTTSTAPATPTLSISGATSVTEGTNEVYTVTLSAAQATATTATFTLAGTGGAALGTNYSAATATGGTLTGTTLSIPAGTVTATITVPTLFQSTTPAGGLGGLSATLSAPSTGITLGAANVATAIAVPPPTTFTLTSDATGQVPTVEGNTITYTITPSGITDKAYTFLLSTTGATVGTVTNQAGPTAFNPSSQTVTFNAGSAAAVKVTETVLNNNVIDGYRGYQTALLTTAGAAAPGITTITGLINDAPGAATTVTLATGTDSPSGASMLITGLLDGTVPANSTLTAVDTLTGTASGNSTLNITAQGGVIADAFNGANVSNIQTVSIRAVGTAGVAVAATNDVGLTSLINNMSTQALTATALPSGSTVTIKGNGVVANGATTATWGAAVATETLTVNGGVNGGLVTLNGTANVANAAVINSTGAANTLGGLTFAAGSVATLTINATTALTTGAITDTPATLATINVSGAAAVTLGALPAAVKTLTASGLTAGVSATLNANTTIAVVGGAGNDTITTGAILATGASVDAGAGTGNILNIALPAHLTAATGALYKNFEVVGVGAAGTYDLSQLAATNTLTGLNITGAGAVTVNNVTSTVAGNVLDTYGAGAAVVTLNDLGPTGLAATTSGQIDTLSITYNDGAAAASAAGALTLTAPGVELINVSIPNANDTFTMTSLVGVAAVTNLTLSGAGNAVVTTGALAGNVNTVIDAHTLAGTLTVTATGETANGLSIKGAVGANTIVLQTAAITGDSVDLSANTAGGSTITAGTATGNAAITLGAHSASDTVNLVAGAMLDGGGGTHLLTTISGWNMSATATVADTLHFGVAPTIITGAAGIYSAAQTGVANLTATTLGGIMTFAGSAAATASAQTLVGAAEMALVGSGVQSTAAFVLGGNTYIVDVGAVPNVATSHVVELIGVAATSLGGAAGAGAVIVVA